MHDVVNLPPELAREATTSRWLSIRDWWRGYTNADLASALDKTISNRRPNAVARLDQAECRAWSDFMRRQIG